MNDILDDKGEVGTLENGSETNLQKGVNGSENGINGAQEGTKILVNQSLLKQTTTDEKGVNTIYTPLAKEKYIELLYEKIALNISKRILSSSNIAELKFLLEYEMPELIKKECEYNNGKCFELFPDFEMLLILFKDGNSKILRNFQKSIFSFVKLKDKTKNITTKPTSKNYRYTPPKTRIGRMSAGKNFSMALTFEKEGCTNINKALECFDDITLTIYNHAKTLVSNINAENNDNGFKNITALENELGESIENKEIFGIARTELTSLNNKYEDDKKLVDILTRGINTYINKHGLNLSIYQINNGEIIIISKEDDLENFGEYLKGINYSLINLCKQLKVECQISPLKENIINSKKNTPYIGSIASTIDKLRNQDDGNKEETHTFNI